MRVKKRGLSPVIASVLLILLVISLLSFIVAWTRGFAADAIEDTSDPNMKLCPAVDFIVINASAVGANTQLEFVNRGNVDIDSFDFKVSYDNGDAETLNLSVGVLVSRTGIGTMDFGVGIKEIEVFAVLGNNSKSVTCSENSVYLGF